MLKTKYLIKIKWNAIINNLPKGKRLLFNIELNDLLGSIFPPQSDFRFIQIGANDGISHDNLFEFVKDRNSRGLVIEPIKEYYDKLLHNYKNLPNIIALNVAIHPNNDQIILYKVNNVHLDKLPDWANGIASMNKDHHKKLGIEDDFIIEEKVKALSFEDIINEYKDFVKADLLQIDTEGFDYEIIKMIDFNKCQYKFIKYEHCNLTENEYNKSMNILTKNGYKLFKIGNDTIAFNKNL